MFQIQSEPYRAAAGETQRNAGLKRRRVEDSSVEERSYTPRSRKQRPNEVRVQQTAAGLTAIPFQTDQFRGAPSPLQLQHDTSSSDQFRELGFYHIPESAGAGSSGRLESGKIELQKNQNTVFFPSSSNLQVVDSNFTSFRDHIVSNSNVFINVNRPKNNETVFVRVPTGDGSEERPEISKVEITSLKQPLQIHKSSEIYYRHLLTLGRGSPLWIPEPSTSLPIEYQKAGIGIGDVGILKESGGFDFLFNVYQPCNDANHPINPRMMPDGFFPLCPPEERDVNSHVEFKNHSFLASSHVNSRHEESSGFIFESSAEDGAILTMPKGANSIDLDNMGLVRKYISQNVQKWYMYANEVRGRNAGNGDLRLVIGKTSATTWGMAAFARSSDEDTPSCLKFKPTRSGDGYYGESGHDASSPKYRWEYSGNMKAEVKSGPDDHEIEKLRNFDWLRGGDGQMAYENQCLFVRTINVTLQERQQHSSNLGQPQAHFKFGPENFSSLDVGTPTFAEYDGQEWQPARLSRNPMAPAKHRDSRNIPVGEESELGALPPISRLFEIGGNASNSYFRVGTGARARVLRNSAVASGQPGILQQIAYTTNSSLYPVYHPHPQQQQHHHHQQIMRPQALQSFSIDLLSGWTPHSYAQLYPQSASPRSASSSKGRRHRIDLKGGKLLPRPAERACDACRRREVRCYASADSDPPVCQQCKQYGFRCTFLLPELETRLEKTLGSEEKMENAADAASRTDSEPGPSELLMPFRQVAHLSSFVPGSQQSHSAIPHSASSGKHRPKINFKTLSNLEDVSENVPKPAGRACDSCRSREVRCYAFADSDPPVCQRCKEHGFRCTFLLPELETRFEKKLGSEEKMENTVDAASRTDSKPGSSPSQLLTASIGWKPADQSYLSYAESSLGPNGLSLQRKNEASETGDQVRQGGSVTLPSSSPPRLPTSGTSKSAAMNQIRWQEGPVLPAYKGGAGYGRPVRKSESHVAFPVTFDPPPDSSPPLPSHLHPSKIINEYLLKYASTATMAITEDGDWISVLQESDTAFPADEVLLSRIQDKYDVGFEEGVVFLRRKNETSGYNEVYGYG